MHSFQTLVIKNHVFRKIKFNVPQNYQIIIAISLIFVFIFPTLHYKILYHHPTATTQSPKYSYFENKHVRAHVFTKLTAKLNFGIFVNRDSRTDANSQQWFIDKHSVSKKKKSVLRH